MNEMRMAPEDQERAALVQLATTFDLTAKELQMAVKIPGETVADLVAEAVRRHGERKTRLAICDLGGAKLAFREKYRSSVTL